MIIFTYLYKIIVYRIVKNSPFISTIFSNAYHISARLKVRVFLLLKYLLGKITWFCWFSTLEVSYLFEHCWNFGIIILKWFKVTRNNPLIIWVRDVTFRVVRAQFVVNARLYVIGIEPLSIEHLGRKFTMIKLF